jgi:hypothetical protein
MADDRSQARREAAILLGVDIEHLSAADSLRVDMISALRLVIDSEQASVLDGGSADLGKLNIAVQSLIALLPNRELPQPERDDPHDPDDPRERLWTIYKTMRDRAASAGQGYDGLQRENERLRAEIAQLKGETTVTNVTVEPTPAISEPPTRLPDNVAVLSRAVPKGTPVASSEPPQSPPTGPRAPWDDFLYGTPSSGKYWGPIGS